MAGRLMAVVSARIFVNSYRDSVELMQIAASIEGRDGIERAGLVMATPANRDVLAAAGLLTDAVGSAGPNDLVVAVAATDDETATAALDEAMARLTGGPGGDGAGEATATTASTLAEAVTELEGANIVLIATPGAYASAEARKALKRGLHVFMFSDNVPVEDEIELKALARERGLLLMGPDCGTAILDGVPLGFANHVRRGTIGLAGASGTGLQQVTSLIDRFGAGVSQAIGVGGRDLDERVGGVMMIDAIERLAADPGTAVIVLISKPPAASVAERVMTAASKAGKPVVVNLLDGDPKAVAEAGLTFAGTFEDAARLASALALGQPTPDTGPGTTRDDERNGHDSEARTGDLTTGFAEGQRRIRGLYSGGSLAGEAKLLLKTGLGAEAAKAHEILDLGDDEYTVGRPHPMIDPRLRNEKIEATAADPTVAVILLDVVLGTGANPDPAGVLVPAIEAAQATATREGRRLVVVASVCGTDGDPQGLAAQERTLADAGVVLAPSNARAARIAASIAASLSGTTVGGPA
ncbi:MAG: acyl-CoA synthetase FdrA [Candidatus Limnocylindrales bacterium]